jgi:hypothetical protein
MLSCLLILLFAAIAINAQIACSDSVGPLPCTGVRFRHPNGQYWQCVYN